MFLTKNPQPKKITKKSLNSDNFRVWIAEKHKEENCSE
jgi:hypothetical protein